MIGTVLSWISGKPASAIANSQSKTNPCSISVIIPALNEEENIESTITRVLRGRDGGPVREVIVVDGGSSDKTVAIARRLGAKVLRSPRGRAKQMNTGAKAAGGELLLFLHADSLVPHGYPRLMNEAIVRSSVQSSRPCTWGCFETVRFDAKGWKYRVIEQGAKLRTKFLGLPYGDQGIFVSSASFSDLGGYREQLPLMEDADLATRLSRAAGPMAVVPRPIVTSARRYRIIGPFKTAILNSLIITGWKLGVPVTLLAKVYHSTGVKRFLMSNSGSSSTAAISTYSTNKDTPVADDVANSSTS